MISSASHYIDKGTKKAKLFLKQNIWVFFQYGLFCLSALIGKLFCFSYPLFALAELRLSTKIIEEDQIGLDNIYADASDIKKVWHSTIVLAVKLNYLIVGAILFGGLTYGFSVLGKRLDNTFFRYYYLLPFFIWAGAIGFVIYLLIVVVNFSLTNFLIQQFDDMNISKILEQSKKLMNKKAKITLLLIFLVHVVKAMISFSICILLPYFIFIDVKAEGFIIVMMIASVLFLFTLPRIILSYQLASTSLFQDLLKEGYINLELSEGDLKAHGKALKEQLLKTLFNSKDTKDLEQELIITDEEGQ